MKLLILTTLLVIVVFTFLLINYNSYHSNESFQNTGYSQCVFMPTTVNGGFGSLLHVKIIVEIQIITAALVVRYVVKRCARTFVKTAQTLKCAAGIPRTSSLKKKIKFQKK